MTEHNLPKTYDFKSTEERIYDWWVENGFFKPSNDPNQPNFDPSKKPFVISIPPPNVTGRLHQGHAMFVSMEDLMIRYHRMKGIPTLWVPGSDHAGIATQLQVEKLLKAEGLTREEVGREDFIERTWEWKEKYGGIITHQIRRLGASCDWDRERFTLDDGLSKAVREAFVHLYDKGLIYRGPRLINWSPGLKTAVSDLEVEYSQEQGTLYYFKYILCGFEERAVEERPYIPVATTRPETILGDTAVAVHPEDDRFKHFAGKKVIVPILGREIPVVCDEYVDLEFGTGALKITPGHDPNDYAIGERHDLEVISILDKDAHINQNGGPYAGQDRFECRQNIWEDMSNASLVIKEEPYMMKVPRAQRGGEIIEPMISTQWFVSAKPLAEPALEAVRDGRIRIVPQHFTKVYYNWMENIEDWCISRQLWWGHRIPVWYCQECSQMIVAREDPTKCSHCGSSQLKQDADVLDTWFSSGLWPFSTLGWPEETPDFNYFYPTTLMETGYDILFFWVARMIMSGLEYTGKVPFNTIYLHGLIRDAQGRKMSKSYGNVIDPLEVMDELGTDALRFTLLVGSTPGKDMNLDLKKVVANRNFANKVWNATRLVLSMLGELDKDDAPTDDPDWTLSDSWIWARRRELIRDVERLITNFQYGEAGRQIYDFFWNEFADWYLEIAKLQMKESGDRAYYTAFVLVRVLDTCLRLLHPYTPFFTEELWGHLKKAVAEHPLTSTNESFSWSPKEGWAEALIIASWPEPTAEEAWEKKAIGNFEIIQEIVRSIRNLRAEKKVKAGQRLPATLVSPEHTQMLEQQVSTIASLAKLRPDAVDITTRLPSKPEDLVALVVRDVEIFMPLTELVDKAEEQTRLEKELKEVQTQIQRLENLLAGPFSQKAPDNVVQKEHQRLSVYRKSAEKLRQAITDNKE